MDKTTRKVLVVIAALFGLFFLVAGVLLLEGRSVLLGVIYIPLGLLWLVAAVFIYRRVPKL
jgi:hypothetical protein